MVGRVVFRVRRDCHGRVVELGGRDRRGVGGHRHDLEVLGLWQMVVKKTFCVVCFRYRTKAWRRFVVMLKSMRSDERALGGA